MYSFEKYINFLEDQHKIVLSIFQSKNAISLIPAIISKLSYLKDNPDYCNQILDNQKSGRYNNLDEFTTYLEKELNKGVESVVSISLIIGSVYDKLINLQNELKKEQIEIQRLNDITNIFFDRNKIRLGMTRDECLVELGEPDKISHYNYKVKSHYIYNSKGLELLFYGDTLITLFVKNMGGFSNLVKLDEFDRAVQKICSNKEIINYASGDFSTKYSMSDKVIFINRDGRISFILLDAKEIEKKAINDYNNSIPFWNIFKPRINK